ncbi:MAG TPA: threonine synthase [Candidatus Krumholzibacteria bacterium]|nr:threonine synthase [Candidatus Krumholzibacteria bacterium]HPD70310.1 threonine synthase [Candidatus Krumholzibacteria bacterium]HRY39990.1 threonine synthase [Candidatus Krumholzibacteria bacterium]
MTAPLFYSTNRSVPEVDLGQALLAGQAGDRGLFLPRAIPRYGRELLLRAGSLAYPELAAALLAPYCEGTFSRAELEEICEDAYDFDVPLESVDPPRWVMRLDQGPTASFKDFAARFMGRALGRLVRQRGRRLVILTATSGDTGSAIAHAFHGVAGIEVVVLFPINEVSDRQRRQMTTLGGNIRTLALDSKFDDCQALVKEAFADPDLAPLDLSSANSINIGRLLPQSVYYVYAASRLVDLPGGEPVVFSVPSGNFGDLMGGLLAKRSGLPVRRFVIATNANDEVPRFLATGRYEKIVPSRKCISNAMNVGHPSNLARIVDLYGGHLDETGRLLRAPDLGAMRRDFYAVSIVDQDTRAAIVDAYRRHRTILEPHGAVGWAGLDRYLAFHAEDRLITSIALETAHPAKFPEEIASLLGLEPAPPASLRGLEGRRETYEKLPTDYQAFKADLLRHHGRAIR